MLMKTITSKEINEIIEKNTDPLDNIEDDQEIYRSVCWEAKVDRDKKKIILLIDGKEELSTSLNKFKDEEVTEELLVKFIDLLKRNKMKELKKIARIK